MFFKTKNHIKRCFNVRKKKYLYQTNCLKVYNLEPITKAKSLQYRGSIFHTIFHILRKPES